MGETEAQRPRRYKHVFLDAEGTLYVPKHNRSRWEFWADPNPEAAVEFFELDRGVREALARLREQVDTLCVVSKNTDAILGALLEKFGIGDCFDNIMLNGNKGKLIEEYLLSHGLRKEDSLMVGDMPVLDLYPVKKVGVDSILVDREYNRWARAERIRGIFELPAWLKIADMAERGVGRRARNSTLDEFPAGASADCTKSLIAVPGV
ncbi:MAG: hypothetical protein A3K67_07125 [Euryarchaeota archaeon RBG_16_62_10]|nr:MAG: hypothetical protein A3K67_07125 [Euryarchaeota archaeon RBG_16_62_10]